MWDTKYRPMRFSDVLGQEGAVQVLRSRLVKGTALDTSYIFSGGHGRGKSTLSRILGRALLCSNITTDGEPCNTCDSCQAIINEASPAFSELDAASNGTVEIARTIVDKLDYVVTGGAKRIYVFDEVHRMSTAAQDVFLKPLEDKRLVGIFCTTEPEKIRGAIRSRCEEHPIRKVTREDILKRLSWILQQEGVSFEDDAVLTVIDHSGGHVRDAINKLEMIAQLGAVTTELVREHLNLSVVTTFYEILLALPEPAKAVLLAEEACERVGPEAVAEGLAEAAMNSFRLANNMFAEFAYTDRNLSAEVHKRYGNAVTKLAEYFLRSYRTSKTSLLTDIIACASGVPSSQAVTAAAPILVMAPTTQSQPISQPSTNSVVKTQTAPTSEQVTIPPPVHVPKQPALVGRRSDGIGDLGSSNDVQALTTLDTKAVPAVSSRGRDVPKPAVIKDAILTPSEWRVKFLYLRTGMGGS